MPPATFVMPGVARLRGRLPGFLRRLSVGQGLALLAAYALLATQALAGAGSPLRYVARSDFRAALTGAEILVTGRATLLYDRATQSAVQTDLARAAGYAEPIQLLPFIHTPLELVLVAPLRALGLSPVGIFALWTVLSLLALAGAIAALQAGRPAPRPWRAPAALAVLTFYPLVISILLGQATAFLLLALALALLALRRGRDGWAGGALALVLIKPQFLIGVLLALLLLRRWRALLSFGATAGALGLGSLLLLGPGWPAAFLRISLSVGGYPPDPTSDPANMPNWRGLLVGLLGDSPATPVLTTALAALTLLALCAVCRRIGRRAPAAGQPEWDRLWALILCATLLGTLYLQRHDAGLFVLPAWLLVTDAGPQAGAWRGWVAVGWVAGLLVTTSVLPVPPLALWLVLTAGALAWQVVRPAAPGPSTRPAPAPS